MDDEEKAATNAAAWGATTAEQRARLVDVLDGCKHHDDALTLFKRCVGGLEKTGLPRAAVHATLQSFVDLYAAGIEFPQLGNAALLEAERGGVPRDVLVFAAKATGYAKRGGNAKANLRNRISNTKKQVKQMNAAAEIPTEELLGIADLHSVAMEIVKARASASELENGRVISKSDGK